ncbi:MAG: glycoside hydrolase family 38 C-terminal domain-containing protein, partial [Gemmatimonadaceae bacterium]
SAWRTLLRAHPHDTLCGCSIDAVARAMEVRIESAVAQARGLRLAGLNIAMQRDAVAARSGPLSAEPQLVVRNRCARWRGGLAEVLLDETVGDAPVGPSSANADKSENDLPQTQPTIAGLPLQVIGSKLVFRRRESPQHYPDNDRVREHRALVWLPAVPPTGLVAYPLRFDVVRSTGARSMESESQKNGTDISMGSESLKGDAMRNDSIPQCATTRVLENELELTNGRLTVVVGPRGVRITSNGRTLHNALTFESTRDVGDSYTPAIRDEPELLQIWSVKLGSAGPLRVSAILQLRTVKKRRGVRLRATLILDAESDVLRVDITGSNERRDHRLRVNFSTDVVGSAADVAVFADAAFGPVERPVLNVPAHDQTREMVPPTMPMHRWVAMSGANGGATLHADGLAEVEANRTTGTISLTILRAIGELSRADLAERPGHAGWPTPIPSAQSQGAFYARIGLQLHESWSQATLDAIENASDSLLVPLIGETVRDLATPLTQVIGPQLDGNSLRVSTITLADDEDGIILRCVNDSNAVSGGTWTLPHTDAFEFAHARLDESLESNWSQAGNTFTFNAQPRAVVTIRVRRSHTPN